MAFISWPDQTTLGTDFVYDKTAGTGVTVYIVDTGEFYSFRSDKICFRQKAYAIDCKACLTTREIDRMNNADFEVLQALDWATLM